MTSNVLSGEQAPVHLRNEAVAGARLTVKRGEAALFCVAVLSLIGLFGRIMSYPLQHDEQLHIPAGVMVGKYSLYSDLGYTHLPNLPYLLHFLYGLGGGEHYLLIGRLAAFAWWLAALAALALIAWRATGTAMAVAFAVLLPVTDMLLLGQSGMLVTNSFTPIPFALFGFHFFERGINAPAPRPALIAAAGLCLALAIGFKANYIFLAPAFALAAFCVPRDWAMGKRIKTIVLPLAAGALIGGLPSLILLARGPDAFFAHTIGYFTGPHHAYWIQANVPKSMSLSDKIQLADTVWFSSSILLAGVAAACLLLLPAYVRQPASDSRRIGWPIGLMAALVVLGMVISFVPTPAFPQYYTPPVMFLIVLAVLAYGNLGVAQRSVATPILAAAILLALLGGLPRLGLGLSQSVRPGKWTGIELHNQARAIAKEIGPHPARARVMTLSPIIALEAGFSIYPEFAAGPFEYRVADLVPAEKRRYLHNVSPRTLPAFLDAGPPVAILTGLEGNLDAGLSAYARSHAYREIRVKGKLPLYLFVAPGIPMAFSGR